MYYRKKGLFESFFENRSFLIMQLENGDMDKPTFIRENYDFLSRIGATPFARVNSMEKGIFNYQYYNIMAKYYRSVAIDLEKRGKHPRVALSYRHKSDDQYHKKNLDISYMLNLVEYENVEAYYVKSKSKFLKDKLYEIVFLDYDKAIFHSTADWLLNNLKENNCFIEGKRKSLIDDYINTRY